MKVPLMLPKSWSMKARGCGMILPCFLDTISSCRMQMLFCRDRPMAVASVFEICASGQCDVLGPHIMRTGAGNQLQPASHLAGLVISARALEESDLNAEVQHPPVNVLIETRRIRV